MKILLSSKSWIPATARKRFNRSSWLIIWNSELKSSNTSSTRFPALMSISTSFTTLSRAVSQLNPGIYDSIILMLIIFFQGCWTSLEHFLKSHLIIIGGIGLGFSLLQASEILFIHIDGSPYTKLRLLIFFFNKKWFSGLD